MLRDAPIGALASGRRSLRSAQCGAAGSDTEPVIVRNGVPKFTVATTFDFPEPAGRRLVRACPLTRETVWRLVVPKVEVRVANPIVRSPEIQPLEELDR